MKNSDSPAVQVVGGEAAARPAIAAARYKYLDEFEDKTGMIRRYLRVNGRRTHTFKHDPQKEPLQFAAEYNDALDLALMGRKKVVLRGRPSRNSVAALVMAYLESPEFKSLADQTKRSYRARAESVREQYGHLDWRVVKVHHLYQIRNTHQEHPSRANDFLQIFRFVGEQALQLGVRETNPAKEVKELRMDTVGYLPWTRQQVNKFKKEASPKALLAFLLLYRLGQRREDTYKLEWEAYEDNNFEVLPQKTMRHYRDPIVIPAHRELRAVLDSAPRTATTIIVNEHGKPFARGDSFATWFNAEVAMVFGPDNDLTIHGLRKNAVINLLEAGCSPSEVRAITQHSLEMIEHYSKLINQKIMAQHAMEKMELYEDEESRRVIELAGEEELDGSDDVG
jgi:hypothetical protein